MVDRSPEIPKSFKKHRTSLKKHRTSLKKHRRRSKIRFRSFKKLTTSLKKYRTSLKKDRRSLGEGARRAPELSEARSGELRERERERDIVTGSRLRNYRKFTRLLSGIVPKF